jgi:regulatory protein
MRRWISLRRSETAIDTALRFLARRPRAEHEVRLCLRRAGADEAAADAAVRQLREHRLLDDAAFARYWVEQRQTFRPRGARLLRTELVRFGVEASVAKEASAAAEDAAVDDAYRAAARRAVQLRGLDQRSFQTRLGGFLARRGFDWEVVAQVVERLWQESGSSPESGTSPAQ